VKNELSDRAKRRRAAPEMHESVPRVTKADSPTFDKSVRACAADAEARGEFNVLTTVHAGNGDHPLEVYRFLRDEVRTRFIQLKSN